MDVHGLTGGIGSGKSTVAAMLTELGVPVLDADQFARDVVAPGTQGLQEITEAFGPSVIQDDGSLDRPKLGSIIFGDAEKRRHLESIIHPRVRLAMAQALDAHRASGATIAFMDIPLLYEARDPKDFKSVAVVYVPASEQLKRVMARDGLNLADAQARIDAQMPIDHKANLADWIIDNSEDRAFTRSQVELLVARLRYEAQ